MMAISIEELSEMRVGQFIVVGDGDALEVRDICPSERRFSAFLPTVKRVVAYEWDTQGVIYHQGHKALQSETTHLADTILTPGQVRAICREKMPEVLNWLEVERFEFWGGKLHAYAGDEILPYDSIDLDPSRYTWPEETPA